MKHLFLMLAYVIAVSIGVLVMSGRPVVIPLSEKTLPAHTVAQSPTAPVLLCHLFYHPCIGSPLYPPGGAGTISQPFLSPLLGCTQGFYFPPSLGNYGPGLYFNDCVRPGIVPTSYHYGLACCQPAVIHQPFATLPSYTVSPVYSNIYTPFYPFGFYTPQVNYNVCNVFGTC